MTQSIVVQVGQCGNQIGTRFWDLALQEYAALNKKGEYNDSIASFFRNSDRSGASVSGSARIDKLKARAVLIDMEEGVVSQALRSEIGGLFDSTSLLTSESGSGNNYAVGHCHYWQMYSDRIEDLVRRNAEQCDALASFLLLHSVGGGTGSGLGTAVLEHLADAYPTVMRFTTSAFPNLEDDDVITSPYNTVLALRNLSASADCVFPLENAALCAIVRRELDKNSKAGYASVPSPEKNSQAFDLMNNIVAHMLLNLTAFSRFDGALNVDLNEIATNLVPFPRTHYLLSAHAPLNLSNALPTASGARGQSVASSKRLDSVLADVFDSHSQLVGVDPVRNGVYVACALLFRGAVQLGEIRSCVDRLVRDRMGARSVGGPRFVPWNADGWKVGHCGVAPPTGHPFNVLALANNTCVTNVFRSYDERFTKLYRRRAHMHHYAQVDGFDESWFADSIESLRDVIERYQQIETARPGTASRLNVLS